MMDDLFKGARVAMAGWDDFFGTVLETYPDSDPDNDQVLVRWDHMNDDGNYTEWVHPLAIALKED